MDKVFKGEKEVRNEKKACTSEKEPRSPGV